MVDLLEAVRHHCGDLDTTLLDRHFRRLPPIYFVILLRITGNPHGKSLTELAAELRDRLRVAFGHLARGNLLQAQTVASDTSIDPLEVTQKTPMPLNRPAPEYEGMILGGDFCLQRKLAVGGMSE